MNTMFGVKQQIGKINFKTKTKMINYIDVRELYDIPGIENYLNYRFDFLSYDKDTEIKSFGMKAGQDLRKYNVFITVCI